MAVDFRLPQINNGASEKEQLTQVKNYLYQLVSQLQWALKNVDTSSIIFATPQTPQSSSKPSEVTPMDAQATFNSIKGLIMKSAEIVEAYYEELNSQFSGVYTAQSDFGIYIEETEQKIEQNSTGIEQTFSNIQRILTDLENLNFTLAEVNAHINAGILYYDDNGIPVYGLEIGQKNYIDGEEVFNKYARFISDRLSFYDNNGTEVAYISDYKLYITHVEITGSVKGGGFKLNLSKGLTLKWVGRS